MSFGAQFIPSRDFGLQNGDAYSGCRSHRSAGLWDFGKRRFDHTLASTAAVGSFATT
jgi:hypothetical protein